MGPDQASICDESGVRTGCKVTCCSSQGIASILHFGLLDTLYIIYIYIYYFQRDKNTWLATDLHVPVPSVVTYIYALSRPLSNCDWSHQKALFKH